MKCSELKKMLTAGGCYLVRHGKRHDVWFSPITGMYFVLPRHEGQEVPAGTLSSIKKAAGV